ncbi:hypothetical protein GIB67_031993 [Kingdonia uniflora]|uniref:Uncharacterized protein n=1 Tax=Kingdonia uniflora TaxID=39325 RepID=A0A7J7MWR3_9MAGN|nr:hypothetical protein GIB67_031993 [Kingdonia uniflora]
MRVYYFYKFSVVELLDRVLIPYRPINRTYQLIIDWATMFKFAHGSKNFPKQTFALINFKDVLERNNDNTILTDVQGTLNFWPNLTYFTNAYGEKVKKLIISIKNERSVLLKVKLRGAIVNRIPIFSGKEVGQTIVTVTSTTAQQYLGIPWSEEEHRTFLEGLGKLKKGYWRGISKNFVLTRTPTQVTSHAQKFFLRQATLNKKKRRSGLFDLAVKDPGQNSEGSLAVPVKQTNDVLPKVNNDSIQTPAQVASPSIGSLPATSVATSHGIPSFQRVSCMDVIELANVQKVVLLTSSAMENFVSPVLNANICYMSSLSLASLVDDTKNGIAPLVDDTKDILEALKLKVETVGTYFPPISQIGQKLVEIQESICADASSFDLPYGLLSACTSKAKKVY